MEVKDEANAGVHESLIEPNGEQDAEEKTISSGSEWDRFKNCTFLQILLELYRIVIYAVLYFLTRW